jgi:hypothetical protein
MTQHFKQLWHSRIKSTKSPSFWMTAFGASLTNVTVLLHHSRDCSYYVSRPILAPPPLWLQKHTELCAHDFAHSSDLWHQSQLAKHNVRLKLETLWKYSCCNEASVSYCDSLGRSYRHTIRKFYIIFTVYFLQFRNYTPTKCTIFSLYILYSSTPTHVSAFTRSSSGGS